MARVAAKIENDQSKDVSVSCPEGSGDSEAFVTVSGLMFGGGQKVVLDLIACSGSQGRRLRLVVLGCLHEELREAAFRCIQYDGRYNRPLSLIGAAWRLRAELRRSSPKLIHSHGWDADIIGSLARTGLRMKQVIHIHVTPDWLGSRAGRHWIRRWITRLALTRPGVRIVAVSDAVRSHWASGLGLASNRIRVVRNGVDIVRFQPGVNVGDGSEPVIGVAARLVPMKGIEYLLDALGILAREGFLFRLKIAGSGSLRDALDERCVCVGIRERTEFLGHFDRMSAFYHAIDLYVLPSVSTEGLPLGVLEAMASGVPVLATTVGGTPEAVRDGVDGVLVPPRDVNALADGLRRLLGDVMKRRAMGRAGRARAVEAFSLERFSDEIFALYRETLAEHRA